MLAAFVDPENRKTENVRRRERIISSTSQVRKMRSQCSAACCRAFAGGRHETPMGRASSRS